MGLSHRKRTYPLSQTKLQSLTRMKDLLDNKIQEIEAKLTQPQSQFRQKSLSFQRHILQSFKTSTINRIAQLEKGINS